MRSTRLYRMSLNITIISCQRLLQVLKKTKTLFGIVLSKVAVFQYQVGTKNSISISVVPGEPRTGYIRDPLIALWQCLHEYDKSNAQSLVYKINNRIAIHMTSEPWKHLDS